MNKPPRIIGLSVVALTLAIANAVLWSIEMAWPVWILRLAACLATATLLCVAAWMIRKVLHWRAASWVKPYLFAKRTRYRFDEPLDICFGFMDHFEPDHASVPSATQVARVEHWEAAYLKAVAGHRDSDGRCPQHTWFVPLSITAPAAMPKISQWPGLGWGELEYHLHHDDHPEASCDDLRRQIRSDIASLQKSGAVTSGRYAFIHGMFALAGGDPRYCRAAGEIDVLLETGCYADFTFPALGTPAQPRQVNSIFYACPNGRPKPHDQGVPAVVGSRGKGLLIVPGPMCFGLFPRVLDDGNVSPDFLPSPSRLSRWLEAHIHVSGRPNWVFVHVHSHSASEEYADALFAGAMQSVWGSLESRLGVKNGQAVRLHYVTARESYNIIRAAEDGLGGNPNDYRDFEIPPPSNRLSPKSNSQPTQNSVL